MPIYQFSTKNKRTIVTDNYYGISNLKIASYNRGEKMLSNGICFDCFSYYDDYIFRRHIWHKDDFKIRTILFLMNPFLVVAL